MIKPTPLTISTNRQNAHLTFKHNAHHGRHGWLRLTPAYSLRLVDQILASAPSATKILDPFSGTGTTALCAAYMGKRGIGIEINPFLAWVGSVKGRCFSPGTIAATERIGAAIGAATARLNCPIAEPPPIHNISRWWNERPLRFLSALKECIGNITTLGSDERDLILIAFCRTVIQLSNAAFNHQSMSFKQTPEPPSMFESEEHFADNFIENLSAVLKGASDNPPVSPKIVSGDARTPSRFLAEECDLLITSPPYPNRISYIRELRPYMYWLGYLTNGRDAGELDWQAIGGTWGIATSRLADWKPSKDVFVPPSLRRALKEISRPENPNGRLLANYVAKYFEDIWHHLTDVRGVLASRATVHYIVGNSTFYGALLPVETIYGEMLLQAGFKSVGIERIRKRNSKAELYEFDVTATKMPARKGARPISTRNHAANCQIAQTQALDPRST
ncbi:hypothetical protein HYR69_10475 [Candidatus Sumerlaeota bacterium]|nr:hypothetical protein [Candidatus Sumerlaeota bacterium]